MSETERNRVRELQEIVAADPGAQQFVELASLLSKTPEFRPQAREVCFKGLTLDPHNLKARLVLAKLFYLDQMPTFCLRELGELKKQIGTLPSLDLLLEELGAQVQGQNISSVESEKHLKHDKESQDSSTAEVLAEVDLEGEFIDILDDLEEK